MRTRRLPQAELDPAVRITVAKMLERQRFELIPLSNVLDEAAFLPEGATVTVTASPQKGQMATVDTCVELQHMGFRVVPHLSARLIRDRNELQTILDRLDHAAIQRAFVIGGDGDPQGEFFDGLALLTAMGELGHCLTEIGLPGYPEGHPTIESDIVERALKDKAPYASYITSNMCFDAGAISKWIGRLRSAGLSKPIELGIPGVLDITKLISISLRIGVGPSTRFLNKHSSLAGQLVRPGGYGPDQLILDLADDIADPVANIIGFHIYTFNSVAATVAWQHRMLEALE